MTTLRIFADHHNLAPQFCSDTLSVIQSILAKQGVTLKRWSAQKPLPANPSQDDVAAAYAEDIERLMQSGGYQTWDVVSMRPSHPNKEQFRKMFLDEHRHGEDEVRFFVSGQGLFSMHLDACVFELTCEAGDLISVPAGTPHWFDMGPNPNFTAIRLFNNPAGWVAHWTGDNIASRYSRLSN